MWRTNLTRRNFITMSNIDKHYDFTIPVDGTNGKPRKNVGPDTAALRTRLMLDGKSRDNVKLIAAFIEREYGATLSLSLVVRLALRHLVGNLSAAIGEGDDLAKKIKAAASGV